MKEREEHPPGTIVCRDDHIVYPVIFASNADFDFRTDIQAALIGYCPAACSQFCRFLQNPQAVRNHILIEAQRIQAAFPIDQTEEDDGDESN